MAIPDRVQLSPLSAAELMLRSAFEDAPIGMAVAALDGHVLDVNAALASLLGYDRDELVGRHLGELTHPDNLEANLRMVAELLQGGGATFRMEQRCLQASGEEVWVLLCVSVVRDEAGSPLTVLAQVVDITESRRNQERLEGLVESKDELIAGLSHELRSPIAVVMGSSDELRKRRHHLDPGDIDALFGLILTESVRVAEVVDDFVVAARAQSGSLGVSRESISLDRELAIVLRSWTGGGVTTADLTPVYVAADRNATRHVARNLLSNAVRHGGDQIGVAVSRRSACGVLRVTDNGEGIPPELATTLFEPHRRRPGDGLAPTLGLGLFVADALCRAMGGSLSYGREGDLTVFEVCLPISPSSS